MQLLLSLGADIKAQTSCGSTPLWFAVEKQHAQVIYVLVAHILANLAWQNGGFRQVGVWASSTMCEDTTDALCQDLTSILLDCRTNSSALCSAVKGLHWQTVSLLRQAGAPFSGLRNRQLLHHCMHAPVLQPSSKCTGHGAVKTAKLGPTTCTCRRGCHRCAILSCNLDVQDGGLNAKGAESGQGSRALGTRSQAALPVPWTAAAQAVAKAEEDVLQQCTCTATEATSFLDQRRLVSCVACNIVERVASVVPPGSSAQLLHWLLTTLQVFTLLCRLCLLTGSDTMCCCTSGGNQATLI